MTPRYSPPTGRPAQTYGAPPHTVEVYPAGMVYGGDYFPWDRVELWFSRAPSIRQINRSFWQTLLSILRRIGGGADEPVSVGDDRRFHLRRDDGLKIVLDARHYGGQDHPSPLGDALKGQITKAHIARALDLIHSGGSYPFIHYRVTADGLYNGDSLWRWDEIVKVVPWRDGLITTRTGDSGYWHVGDFDMPNGFVLRALVEHILEHGLS